MKNRKKYFDKLCKELHNATGPDMSDIISELEETIFTGANWKTDATKKAIREMFLSELATIQERIKQVKKAIKKL